VGGLPVRRVQHGHVGRYLAPDFLPSMGMKPTDLLYLKTGERIASNQQLAEIRKNDPGCCPMNGSVRVNHGLVEQRPVGGFVLVEQESNREPGR
jgi:hypothetical protein